MKFKCLTTSQREGVAIFLIQNTHDGVLPRGFKMEVAAKWGVTSKTIGKIWKIARQQSDDGESLNVRNKRYGNTNHKRILPDVEHIKSLEFATRSTIRRLSTQVGASLGTVHKWITGGLIRAHSSPLHPQLTESNKIERLKFCLKALVVTRQPRQPAEQNATALEPTSQQQIQTLESTEQHPSGVSNQSRNQNGANGSVIQGSTVKVFASYNDSFTSYEEGEHSGAQTRANNLSGWDLNEDVDTNLRLRPLSSSLLIKFNEMANTIHIDEKWFFITKINQKYYVVPGEELPYRSCKSKRYIVKVMFMCAVCRPLYDDEGVLLFYGKIGMFPFTYEQPAARKSKNKPAGTLETKPVESITKEVTKACLINQIIPAIKRIWPQSASKHIFIQQDNAKPHIKNDDPDFRLAASTDGFNIELVFQPPNSPDLNANDLGFFRALQSLQSERPTKTVPELVESVVKSYEEYNHAKISNIFLILQSVMLEIMKVKGHNNFAIPHMGKGRLEAMNELPRNLTVDEVLVRGCIDYLEQLSDTSGLELLMQQLGYNFIL